MYIIKISLGSFTPPQAKSEITPLHQKQIT